MIGMCIGPRGERSILVHSLKNHIVRELQPKDYLSEILAVRNFAAERIRYSNDALTVEQVQDPERISDQIIKFGRAVGDCDDLALWIATICRQLGREAQFVTVGFGARGRYSHVFTRVKEPKSGQWIVCDPVAGSNEAAMLRRVSTYQIWNIA
jgi:transglutaminase-like putative cysteine protease